MSRDIFAFRFGSAIVLLLLGLFIVFSRLRTYHEPIERDLATYAVVAHEMLDGKRLYTDVWDNKPPAIHITLAVTESVAGYGPLSIYLLNVLINIVVLLGLYKFGTAFFQNKSSGVWLALFWAAISGDLLTFANQPNTEVFINACLVWGAYFLICDQVPGWGGAIAAGLLFSLATMYKHVAITPIIFMAAFGLFPLKNSSLTKNTIERNFLVLFLVGFIWVGVGSYFFFENRLHDFYDAVIATNSRLVQTLQPGKGLFSSVLFHHLLLVIKSLWTVSTAISLFLGLGFLAALLAFYRMASGDRRAAIWLGYFLGAWSAVLFTGLPNPHYLQLLFPPIIIGVELMSKEIESNNKIFWPESANLFRLILFLPLLIYELSNLRFNPVEWSARKYGSQFIASQALSQEINSWLEPGETFYNWGDDTSLYFNTDRRPASSFFLWGYFLRNGGIEKYGDKILGNLISASPELIVISKWDQREVVMGNLIGRWIKAHYDPFPDRPDRGRFFLVVKKGGALERRLSKPGLIFKGGLGRP